VEGRSGCYPQRRFEGDPPETLGSRINLPGSVAPKWSFRTLAWLSAHERCRTERCCVHSQPRTDTRSRASRNTDVGGGLCACPTHGSERSASAGDLALDEYADAPLLRESARVRL